MAMPAPLAAPRTPLYRPATFFAAEVAITTAFNELLFVLGVHLLNMGGRPHFLRPLACMRTFRVSRGWIVAWDAALAVAPASTSLAGFDGGGGGVAASGIVNLEPESVLLSALVDAGPNTGSLGFIMALLRSPLSIASVLISLSETLQTIYDSSRA